MLDINVKTIDGQNRSYSVPDDYSVKQFKEKISTSLSIPVERQRLIFQGRELRDTNLLSEFDVDGKTLHLVQRIPPTQTGNRPRSNTEEPQPTTTPNQPDVQNIIQQLIGGLGEFGQNARFNTTTSADSNGMEVHIDLGNVSQIVNENEIRSRIRNIRRFLTMADARLNRLREIQSGAPLDDTPNSTIIVGSIQTTTALTDGNNIIGFETNQQNIRGPIDPRIFSLAGIPGVSNLFAGANQNSENNTPNPPPQNEQPQQPEQQEPATPQSIGVEVLAEMTQSVMDAYSRFQPFLQQYHTMLTNDANEPPESPNANSSTNTFNFNNTSENQTNNNVTNNPNVIVLGGDNRRQRFCNNINDMMHLLGHLFHNLSDLHVNIRDRPPRQMHTMSSMSHASSTIIGAAVPVEATIQIPLQVGAGLGPTGSAPSGPAGNQIFIRRRPRSTQSFSTSTTTTTSTTSTSGQETTQPQTNPNPTQIPIPPLGPRQSRPNIPMTNYSTSNSYDQYLPCNSVHFYNSFQPGQNQTQSQRRRHPAGDQQTQNQQQQQAPNNQPSDNISRFLSNILQSTLRGSENQNEQIRVNIGNLPGQIGITTITTSENTTPTTQTPTSTPLINSPRGSSANMGSLASMLFGSGGLNPLSQLFSSIQIPQSNPPNTNTPPTQPNQPNQDRVAGAILREAFNLMDSSQPNEQRLNQPLREFMRMFGSDELDEVVNNSDGQPSLINIFNVFFQSLNLGDMIDLARGNNRHRVFEQTRQPLRQYILNSLELSNENCLTPAHTAQFVDRLYNDIFVDVNGLNINLDQFEVIDDKIDFKKSFEKLVKLNFKKIFQHLFDDTLRSEGSNEQTWSFVLFEHFQNFLNQLVNLFRACCRNADTKLLQVAVEKLRSGLSSGSSGSSFGALFSPFEGFIRNHVQEILNRVQTNSSLVTDLIVYKEEEKPMSSLTSEEDRYDSASSTLSGSSMDIDQNFSEVKEECKIRQEWLPVIENDRQNKSENRDRNFSDAYCSGMPAKKRKILSGKNDLAKENLFKKVLERTLENIQLKSEDSQDKLIEETLEKSELIDSFDQEFDLAITERLRNDENLLRIVKNEEDEMEKEKSSDESTVIYNKGRFSHSRRRLR
ncbi:unnamed protein product [Brachionus calyciflorus]|uniref:BCL2-associated athanogene 6 n=1 Tax=Brachionus calyciflorus TaxID=104777 RepID=A0A813MLZ1_9BILA|nr:unnamed protein product [Brachionus calyciflorus]